MKVFLPFFGEKKKGAVVVVVVVVAVVVLVVFHHCTRIFISMIQGTRVCQ